MRILLSASKDGIRLSGGTKPCDMRGVGEGPRKLIGLICSDGWTLGGRLRGAILGGALGGAVGRMGGRETGIGFGEDVARGCSLMDGGLE